MGLESGRGREGVRGKEGMLREEVLEVGLEGRVLLGEDVIWIFVDGRMERI